MDVKNLKAYGECLRKVGNVKKEFQMSLVIRKIFQLRESTIGFDFWSFFSSLI